MDGQKGCRKPLKISTIASALVGLLPLWASANEGVAPIQAGQIVSFSLQSLEGGMLNSSERAPVIKLSNDSE